MAMVKVRAWTLYNLGDVYGIADCTPEYPSTYIRLVFAFSTMDLENVECMLENDIKYGMVDEYTAFFTTDINIFPTESIQKLKDCISDEMEALINSNVDLAVMKEYIHWFIRNVDTTSATYVDIPLDHFQLRNELKSKDDGPIKEIYENLKRTRSKMKENILIMYPDIFGVE